jgi:hypothetical protein
MKKFLIILSVCVLTGVAAYAQTDNNDEGGGKLQERMREYIQKRLNLTKNEADRFSPVFLRYIGDLRRTHRENSGDRIMLQSKIAELRVQYRNEFRQVLDEQRANKVYDYQREFEMKVIEEFKNRRLENAPNRRIHSLMNN